MLYADCYLQPSIYYKWLSMHVCCVLLDELILKCYKY